MLQGNTFKPSTYSIISLPLDLLREALNCYQNSAYLVVCSMCRACVEALLYLATKLEPTGELSVIEVKENYVREKRNTFPENALKSGLLDCEYKTVVKEIWESGDFAMQIPQKLDRIADDFVKHVSQGHDVGYDLSIGWSDKDEALNTITEKAIPKEMIHERIHESCDHCMAELVCRCCSQDIGKYLLRTRKPDEK